MQIDAIKQLLRHQCLLTLTGPDGIAATDEPDYQQTRDGLQAQLGPADFNRYGQLWRTLTATAATLLYSVQNEARSFAG